MTYVLQRNAGSVYDTPGEALTAAKAAGYPNAIVRFSPAAEGFVVHVPTPEQSDLYLVEHGA